MVYASGYSAEMVDKNFFLEAGVNFISKPIRGSKTGANHPQLSGRAPPGRSVKNQMPKKIQPIEKLKQLLKQNATLIRRELKSGVYKIQKPPPKGRMRKS